MIRSGTAIATLYVSTGDELREFGPRFISGRVQFSGGHQRTADAEKRYLENQEQINDIVRKLGEPIHISASKDI